ncbi:hypothetical protein L249_6064 [Ophiocordyceps polyrhachis-furcata BCC 54312]|uniref:Uncharacterized protein n=1 Tax=Ophiocordyceps polyrhachis-furcata BCC 54312 TaxID=1330021 RepID=A0A367LIU2_9HYPO|nr:hypothetical protein L249_6064 [Ophiocordyceps polyrhachis-furcata BCC 54312]
MDRPRPRPRPAHTRGTTRCAYSNDGTRLVTVGSNNTIRLYKTGSDGEPVNIDDCQEQNAAVATSSDFFVVGSEDGTVSLYSLDGAAFERFLLRALSPIRDVALSRDGQWCAVASGELSVKIVHTTDTTRVRHLREHVRAARHVSLDPNATLAAVSCTDGVVYLYSLTSDEPQLIRKIDGVIAALEDDSAASTRAQWHPGGKVFAIPTPTRDIQIVSKHDGEKQRCFSDGHLADITSLVWSPNGAMLASASKDGKILVWETKTQSVIQRHEYAGVIDLAWHPSSNILSFTTADGEVYIYPEFLPDQFVPLLKLPLQPAPFIHDPLSETGNQRHMPAAGRKDPGVAPGRGRRESLGSLDSFLGPGVDGYADEDDFVVDDDGAGYATGTKRPWDGEGAYGEHDSKRISTPRPRYHEAFQPGSTPWRGNRKYLCLNLIGFVWTVDQDSHHTITVEFYDHELQRDFHFTDTFLYDKACLNERGALFSSPATDEKPAYMFYRPHESWTKRHDWRTELPRGESVVAMSLGESFVTVTTTASYVRVYTLLGMPYRVYRPKSAPMVTCASWRDYVLTVGNGPMGADGTTRLLYTIENVKRDEICQNEDTVALPQGATLKSVFFSDQGDPCIYDSTGTLLTLLHWRRPSRASWVPVLDTKLLPRLASGRKHETYFPVAVADGKFHCIILKGGEQYPYFPRPLLSEFELSVPLASRREMKKTRKKKGEKGKEKAAVANGEEDQDELMTNDDDEKEDDGTSGDDDDDDDAAAAVADDDDERTRLEQQFMLKGVQAAQLRDVIAARNNSHRQRSQLSRVELELDKVLLQLLAVECREGEERGMRAVEMVALMRDRTGRMMEAAGKVAERYGRTVLGEKIREIGERRLGGGGGGGAGGADEEGDEEESE